MGGWVGEGQAPHFVGVSLKKSGAGLGEWVGWVE